MFSVLTGVSDRSDYSKVTGDRRERRQSTVVHLLFFVSGVSALVYQVAYQRLLGLFAGSDSISVAIVVGSFLLGLGLGLVSFPTNRRFFAAIHLVDPTTVILAEDCNGISLLAHESPTKAQLYIGGQAMSFVPFAPIHMLLGLLGPLIHPNPQSALVVGLGTGGTAYAAGSWHTTKR
jgi:hypothetical protein